MQSSRAGGDTSFSDEVHNPRVVPSNLVLQQPSLLPAQIKKCSALGVADYSTTNHVSTKFLKLFMFFRAEVVRNGPKEGVFVAERWHAGVRNAWILGEIGEARASGLRLTNRSFA